ncbi:hypothetical protein RJT34_19870 [Clitoria ternatea]|uniref:Uncharacterized protein n=1 Tax=Clitoria ternatea TaxID=43366 RepID=A0AAN9P519_CLITE
MVLTLKLLSIYAMIIHMRVISEAWWKNDSMFDEKQWCLTRVGGQTLNSTLEFSLAKSLVEASSRQCKQVKLNINGCWLPNNDVMGGGGSPYDLEGGVVVCASIE